MKRKRGIPPLILIAALGVCAPQAAFVAGQAEQTLARGNAEQAVRKLMRQPGKPIDSQLKPTDTEVEVVDSSTSPGLQVADESGLVLESMVRAYDLVALVSVANVASNLTEDRSWVRSTVEAKILEVLKSDPGAPRRYAEGDLLAFPREGGVLRIGQTTVRARVSWARNLAQGQTYLVFGWHPHGELDIPLDAAYQVVGQRLRSVAAERSGRDDIEKDTLDGVRERVERARRV